MFHIVVIPLHQALGSGLSIIKYNDEVTFAYVYTNNGYPLQTGVMCLRFQSLYYASELKVMGLQV